MNFANFNNQIQEILDNAEIYHQSFYNEGIFRGPSLYFHIKSIESRQLFFQDMNGFELYLEYIYATLASWGMHRMGRGGPKMQYFTEFKDSILGLQDEILQTNEIEYQNINNDDWVRLKTIFNGINIMETNIKLIGNSKVMAHLFPHIIPPIDRQHTLRYLQGNTYIPNNIDRQWDRMRKIISNFFIPVATNENFSIIAEDWLQNHEYSWDTSIFKIIDNLIIGAN